MNDLIKTLEAEFIKHADAKKASEMKAYLRNQFAFFGISAPDRREIQKPFLIKKYLPEKSELDSIVKTLWEKPEREYHYFSQELTYRYKKQFEIQDISLFEFMVTHNSWWDTVDFIATKLMSEYFKMYPEQKKVCTQKWLESDHIWLQRSALLFQLKYKDDLDTDLLSSTIRALNHSKEFFITKAIGWILREYSRTDPDWVTKFVSNTSLQPLSKREALRLLPQQ